MKYLSFAPFLIFLFAHNASATGVEVRTYKSIEGAAPQEVFEFIKDVTISATPLGYDQWMWDWIFMPPPPGGVVVIQKGPETIGACSFYPETFLGQTGLVVDFVSVHPNHRRKGLGQTLLEAVATEARLQGYFNLFLSVKEENKGARKLYVQEGFRCFPFDSTPGYDLCIKSVSQ